MKEISTLVPVVAAALLRGGDRVLLQQRRFGAMHGGLWEFPGGKVEAGESLESALVREIREEIGVELDLAAMSPLGFSAESSPSPERGEHYVILLYTCRKWQGEPRCLGGEEIAWFPVRELAGLSMPPLDVPLARRLLETI